MNDPNIKLVGLPPEAAEALGRAVAQLQMMEAIRLVWQYIPPEEAIVYALGILEDDIESQAGDPEVLNFLGTVRSILTLMRAINDQHTKLGDYAGIIQEKIARYAELEDEATETMRAMSALWATKGDAGGTH